MVQYSWTRRIANSIADQLACFALDNLILDCYSGPIPDFVKTIVPSSGVIIW